MEKDSTQELEIRLLLEALRHRCGFDIRHYAQASLRRRLLYCLSSCGIDNISEAIPQVIHDRDFFNKLLYTLSVTFTEFFRDPLFFKILRNRAVSILRTYPFINIWHAGCATGEEVYSMAILLQEEGLMGKVRIYATDFNGESLQKAAEAVYRTDDLIASEDNYKKAGGKGKLSDYYHVENGVARIDPALMKNMVFSSFNLATDSVFTEVHLVLCRNVLIYFDRTLQNRVLKLLHNSLLHGGILCLGSRETMQFSVVENSFLPISEKWRIFQKRVTTSGILDSSERRDRVDRRQVTNRRGDQKGSKAVPVNNKSFKAVVVGCSSGGMVALRMVLSALPKNLPVPIIVVQHLANDTDSEYLATYLDGHSVLEVKGVTDKEDIQPGCVYVAPSGFHLMIEADSTLSLSNDPKHNYSRPAIDILFESAGIAYGDEVIGVLLTGANSDGTKGLKKIMESGGMTIVQDPKTAEAAFMPSSAIKAGVAGRVLPLEGIALELCLMLGCKLP
jgi:chemotaxis protein methyltransferase CheR